MTVEQKAELIHILEDVRRLIVGELGSSVYSDAGGSLTRTRRPELDRIESALRIVAAQQATHAAPVRASGTWGDV